jgi:hypothetical protein
MHSTGDGGCQSVEAVTVVVAVRSGGLINHCSLCKSHVLRKRRSELV